MKWQKIPFPNISEAKGDTIPVEFTDLPFFPARMYFVTAKTGQKRGGHAHIQEEEVFFCVSGSVKAFLCDENGEKELILDQKHEGLYVPTLCWHEFFDFSDGAVLLALSSVKYTPGAENYLLDYADFYQKTCKKFPNREKRKKTKKKLDEGNPSE